MTEKTVNNIGLLVRSFEGLRNGRAFLLLSCGVVAGGTLIAAAGNAAQTVGWLGGLLVAVIALVVYLAGINGAGLLLVDQADNRPGRGVGAAFMGGLHATVTVFLALTLLTLGVVVIEVALYLLSLLAHVPGIGPVFAFLFAGPSAVVLAFCYGLLVIGVPLLLVAVWRGESALGALGRAIDIVLKRPLEALLNFLLLGLIVAPVAVFVIGLFTFTSTTTVAIYAGRGSMFGGGNPYSAFDGFGGGLMATAMDSLQRAGAATASVGFVMLILIALFVLVGMFGYVMVYDSLGAGIDSRAEGRLRGGVSQLKKKMEQHRPQATPAPVPAENCMRCGTRRAPDDQFCGECGQPA